ncbi:hypothetical protein [Absidia glauca]|uniref:Uncharacterized protein n=1 Tax=Absidia glauca TaxID=4829 RepID=A0A163JNB4_ABSGL|nr:hypothetical protein [Absidia glauca]
MSQELRGDLGTRILVTSIKAVQCEDSARLSSTIVRKGARRTTQISRSAVFRQCGELSEGPPPGRGRSGEGLLVQVVESVSRLGSGRDSGVGNTTYEPRRSIKSSEEEAEETE